MVSKGRKCRLYSISERMVCLLFIFLWHSAGCLSHHVFAEGTGLLSLTKARGYPFRSKWCGATSERYGVTFFKKTKMLAIRR
ncbi:MAG: hypothetical protein D6808_01385 [Candidatus Dadabacteria bacterium]|nr:MAG: hypothetical protein D6808_01385 [Candidatus Dadabacteria bacterium]